MKIYAEIAREVKALTKDLTQDQKRKLAWELLGIKRRDCPIMVKEFEETQALFRRLGYIE